MSCPSVLPGSRAGCRVWGAEGRAAGPGSETDGLGTWSHRLAPGPGQPSLDRTGLRAPRPAQPSPGAESLLPSAAPRPVGSLTWELVKSRRNPDSALHPAHAQQRHSSWEDGSSAMGVGTHLSTDLNPGSRPWPLPEDLLCPALSSLGGRGSAGSGSCPAGSTGTRCRLCCLHQAPNTASPPVSRTRVSVSGYKHVLELVSWGT